MIESWQDQLPHEYQVEPIHSLLSSDAQLYFECSHCQLHWRLNPAACAGDPGAPTGLTCRSCRRGELNPVRLLASIEVACTDCARISMVDATGFKQVRCPRCRSSSTAIVGFVDPGFQARFGDLTGASHVWGADGATDAHELIGELAIASGMPDFVRYMVPAAHFARRLYVYGEYPSESHADFMLMTVEANLLRDYYRRTNELTAGIESIYIFEKSVEAAGGHLETAMSEHNVAMAVYSVMSRNYGQVAEVLMERVDLAGTGMDAAERALEHHRASKPDENPDAAMHIARIEHLLGDFLKLTADTDDDLRQAIQHFDRALAERSLPPGLRDAVRDSRASVLVALHDSTAGETSQAESDLDAVLTRDERDRMWSNKLAAWANRALHSESLGDADTAWQAILRAAAIAQDELDRAVDETAMRQVANTYVRVFDQVARIGARQGRVLEAMAALETVRASSLAYSGRGEDQPPDVRRRNLAWQWRAVKGLFGQGGPASTVRNQPDFDHALQRLQRVDMRLLPADSAYLCITGASGTVTAMIVQLGAGGLHVEPHQWDIDPDDLDALALPIDSDNALFDNLDQMIDAGYRMLLEPVWDRLNDLRLRELAVSLPGVLSRLSVEAMVSRANGSNLAAGPSVYNLPSLGLGVELSQRPAPTDPHLLVVTYIDGDLQHKEAEKEALGRAFHGRVTTLSGSRQTKDTILKAMAGDVSHVHFLCHGSFDPLSPLDSALHLVINPHQDPYRITARDLASFKFRTSPIVTLAACSTGLTSYGPANDLSGLAGGFLRAGARGVIGSRWDVHDDAAADFMSALYEQLSRANDSPVTAVSAAQNETRREYDATEDWAAFGYLGAPRFL